MTAQAKPKTEELMDSILLHRDALKKITKFEKNQLIRDAENLRGKISDWDVLDFFGMIACLYGDTTEALKNHDLAFEKYKLFCEKANLDYQAVSEDDYYLGFNRHSTLWVAGMFPECIEAGKKLLEKYPKDFQTIVNLISANLFLGRLHESARLLNTLNEYDGKHIHNDVVVDALSLFEKVGITDEEAEQILSYAFNILHDKNLFLSTIGANIVDECLWIDLYVDFPEPVESVAKEIAKINWEADGILAKNADSKWFDVIMFEFKSVEVLLEEREIIEKKERMSGKW
ncbi:MAG: hypothetical protein PHQ03_01280 [Methylococcales bacterium]|nr:hypothetical protein [Methylococcales bacterium]